MKDPRTIQTALIALMLTPLFLFGQGKNYVATCIGFYNVENLFDTIDSPDVDDAEFLPGSAKLWGTERYTYKLDQLANVIADLGKDLHPNGLAILGLSEVENRSVMEDLVKRPAIAPRNYQIVHYDSPDRRGIDVGLIYDPSRFEMLSSRKYTTPVPEGDGPTRDQLLVSGVLQGDTIHVVVSHWPSRRGGEKASRPKRIIAGQLGRHIVDSLQALNADARVFYMGDLNDDPVDASVRRFLKTSGDQAMINGGQLFNPMESLYHKGIGSLAWRDSWNLFDQICISAPLLDKNSGGYTYYGTRVFNEPYLRQQEGNFAGYPFRMFVGDTYMGGYSDHFPVFLILVKDVK